jgi:MYXO-CTERM domain-containing protein
MRLALAGLLAGALLAAAPRAGAYCRTTSIPVPANYNPAEGGVCWTGTDAAALEAGVAILDLAWPARSRIPYSLVSSASTQVSLADATRIADLAFVAWAQGPGGDAGPLCSGGDPNVHAFDNGPVDPSLAATDCGLIMCPDTVHDGNHLIVFRDDAWSHNDSTSTLAMTTVTYGVRSGTIYDADIEINTFQHNVTTVEPPPPTGYPFNTYDLQAILTHEAGHFLGLAHATDTQAIMYAYYAPGSVALTPDDVAGICTVYPPLPPLAKGGCAVAASGPAPAAPVSPLWAAGVALAVASFLTRRRSLPPP